MKSLLEYWQSLFGEVSTTRLQGVGYDVKEVDGGSVGFTSARYGWCLVFWTPSQRRPVSDPCDELPAFEIRQYEGQTEMTLPSGHALRLDPWVCEQMKEMLEALSS